MKKKSQIELEIAKIEKRLSESRQWVSNALLKGRTDIQVNIDKLSRLDARLNALRWVLNHKK